MKLTAVDYNPFEESQDNADYTLTEVDYDPFAVEPVNPVEPVNATTENDSGFWANTMRGTGERGLQIAGNLVEFLGNVAKEGERYLADVTGINPYISIGSDGISFDMYADPEETGNPFRNAGEAISETTLGYQPKFTWEGLKEDVTPSNVVGYMAEQGIKSIPDMAAALATLPAYIASRTEEIGEVRAENKGKEEVSLQELGEAAVPAVAASLLERIGAHGILSASPTDGIVKGALKGGVKEAATENAQEQIEYAGETVGTDVNFDLATSIDRGLAGAVAGGGIGAAGGAISSKFGAKEKESDDVNPTNIITGESDNRFTSQEQEFEPDRDASNINDIYAQEHAKQAIPENYNVDMPFSGGETLVTEAPEGSINYNPYEQEMQALNIEPQQEVAPEQASEADNSIDFELIEVEGNPFELVPKEDFAYENGVDFEKPSTKVDELASGVEQALEEVELKNIEAYKQAQAETLEAEADKASLLPETPDLDARKKRVEKQGLSPRFVVDDYRGAVKSLAEELTPGGGVAYVRDDNGNINGRTPSINPQWFQNNDDMSSVDYVNKAVEKALDGKPLGKKERRVIEALMDEYDAQAEESVFDLPIDQGELNNWFDNTQKELAEYEKRQDIESAKGDILSKIVDLEEYAESAGLTPEEILSIYDKSNTPSEVATNLYEEAKQRRDRPRESEKKAATGRAQVDSEKAIDGQAAEDNSGGRGGELLSSYTEQELLAKAKEQKEREAAQKQEEEKAEQKVKADQTIDDFALTGSDLPADIAASQGQGDLLSQNEAEQSTDSKQKPIESGDITTKSGAPYTTEKAAKLAVKAKVKSGEITDYTIEPVSGGFVIRPYGKADSKSKESDQTSEDDLLNMFLNPDPDYIAEQESKAEQEKEQKRAEEERRQKEIQADVDKLEGVAEFYQSKIDGLKSKSYKDNKSRIQVGGDPGNYDYESGDSRGGGSYTIGDLNEKRRNRYISDFSGAVKALNLYSEKLKSGEYQSIKDVPETANGFMWQESIGFKPGDIATSNGDPFKTKASAEKTAKLRNKRGEIGGYSIEKAHSGYVIRPNKSGDRESYANTQIAQTSAKQIIEELRHNAENFDGTYGDKSLSEVAKDIAEATIENRRRLTNSELKEISTKHRIPEGVISSIANGPVGFDYVLMKAEAGNKSAIAFKDNLPEQEEKAESKADRSPGKKKGDEYEGKEAESKSKESDQPKEEVSAETEAASPEKESAEAEPAKTSISDSDLNRIIQAIGKSDVGVVRQNAMAARIHGLKHGTTKERDFAEHEAWAKNWLKDLDKQDQELATRQKQEIEDLEQKESEAAKAKEARRKILLSGGIPDGVHKKYKAWLETLSEADRNSLFGEGVSNAVANAEYMAWSTSSSKSDQAAPKQERSDPESDQATDNSDQAKTYIEQFDALWDRLDSADESLTVADVKAFFNSLRENEAEVLAELGKMTKAQLKDYYRGYHDSSMKKAQMVSAVYEDLATSFGFLTTQSSVMSLGGMGRQSRLDGVDKKLDALTDEQLQENIAARKAKREERMAEYKKKIDGVKNPETLEDFRNAVSLGESDSFTPEQWATYDRLHADERLDKQKAAATKTVESVDGDIAYSTHETTHSRKGIDLFVVSLDARVDKDKYTELNTKAKQLGGYYSSYNKQGAIPGFQFTSEENRESFLKVLQGETVEKTKQAKDKTESLEGLADRIEEKANDVLNADRKTNTAKRAREAGYAIENANNELNRAERLRKIADAIREGKTKYLSKVAHGTDEELLQSLWKNLIWNARNKDEGKALTNYKNDASRPEWNDDVTPEQQVRFAEYPLSRMRKDSVIGIAKEMNNTKGYRQAGMKLMKDAKASKDDKFYLANHKWFGKFREFVKAHESNTFVADYAKHYFRLQRMGIETLPMLRAALLEYNDITGDVKVQAKSAVSEKLKYSQLQGKYKDNDFFNTTDPAAKKVVDLAELEEGMTVLEPSAGVGHLADAAAEVVGKGNVTTNELAHELNEFLKEKGYQGTTGDFLSQEPEANYDRIIMNPPFSKDQEITHIEHAYKFLKPGGRLVAITSSMAGERQNKRNKAFREWLDELGAEEHALPQGVFKDAINPTNVNSKIIVIDKPSDVRFSLNNNARSARNGAAVSKVEADKVISRVARKWSGGVDSVRLVDSFNELPDAIKRQAKDYGASSKDINGVFHLDKVYLVRENLRSAREVEETLFHEGYGHYGIRQLLGKHVEKELHRMYFAIGGAKGFNAMAEEFGIDLTAYRQGVDKMPIAGKRLVLMDELLAHIAQHNKPSVKRAFKELIGKIRQFLRKMGFLKTANLDSNELLLVLKNARLAMEGKNTKVYSVSNEVRFNVGGGNGNSRADNQTYFSGIGDQTEKSERRRLRKLGQQRFRDDAAREFGEPVQNPRSTKPGYYQVTRAGNRVVSDSHFTLDAAGSSSGTADSVLGVWAASKESSASAYGDVLRDYIFHYKNPIAFNADVWMEVKPTTVKEAIKFRDMLLEEGIDGLIITGHSEYHHHVALKPDSVVKASDKRLSENYVDYSSLPTMDVEDSGPLFSIRSPQNDESLEKLGLNPKKRNKLADAINKKIAQENEDSFWSLFKHRAYEGMFNGLIGIKRAEDAAGVSDVKQSGYIGARMATGIADVMHGILHYGAPKWEDGALQYKEGTQGLLDILGKAGADLHDFLAWVAAHRAEELMEQGRENNLTQADIDNLKARAQGKERQFREIHQEYKKLNDAMLDMAEEAGLINPEARQAWKSDWYIPFYRQEEDERGNISLLGPRTKRGLSHQTSGIKALKGGAMATNDLLENILANWMKLADASMKNSALVKTVDNLQDTEYLEEIEGENSVDYVGKKSDKNVIRIQREGRSEYYKVHDPALLRAITHLSSTGHQDPVSKAGRYMKRLLTTGVTASPDFILRNFIRDAAHAWAINPDGFKFATDSLKGFKDALREDPAYRELMFAGASFQGGYVHGTDPEASAQIIRRALEKKGLSPQAIHAYEKSLLDTPMKGYDAMKRGWQKYREFGDKIENANRLATYKAARANGKELLQAAFESKDLMDYSLRGNFQLMQYMIDLVPFMNARLQGMSKLARAAKENPKRVLMDAGFKLALFSFALAMLNDDDERYQELPDWDKDANWHFWLGDEHFRIPKPFEIGIVFGTIPERMYHTMAGNQESDKLLWSISHNLWETMAINPTPQFAMPIIESVANRKFFFDAPIEGMSDQGKLPEARYDERTSMTMRIVGDWIGMSPKKLQHLWNGYLGTMGMYALGAADAVSNWATDRPDRPAKGIEDLPVMKVFYRGDGPAKSTQYTTDVYDYWSEVEEIYRTIRAFRKEGKVEEANELQAENRNKLKYRRALGKARKQLGDIRDKMNRISRNRLMDADRKKERIDDLIAQRNAISKRFAELAEDAF